MSRRFVHFACVCSSILAAVLPFEGVAAATDGAGEAEVKAATEEKPIKKVPLAALMASRLIYNEAGKHGEQAANYLRSVAFELGTGTLSLAEADQLLSVAARLGVLKTSTVTIAAAAPRVAAVPGVAAGGPQLTPPPSTPTVVDEKQAMQGLLGTLDGQPAAAASPVAPVAQPVAMPPKPTPADKLPKEEWEDLGVESSVLFVKVDKKDPDSGIIAIDNTGSPGFAVDQHFVIQRKGQDLVRGIILKVDANLVIGTILAPTWTEGAKRPVVEGDLVLAQQRKGSGSVIGESQR